jgi:hypothetical protein
VRSGNVVRVRTETGFRTRVDVNGTIELNVSIESKHVIGKSLCKGGGGGGMSQTIVIVVFIIPLVGAGGATTEDSSRGCMLIELTEVGATPDGEATSTRGGTDDGHRARGDLIVCGEAEMGRGGRGCVVRCTPTVISVDGLAIPNVPRAWRGVVFRVYKDFGTRSGEVALIEEVDESIELFGRREMTEHLKVQEYAEKIKEHQYQARQSRTTE